MTSRYHLTTAPGLEDIVETELTELADQAQFPIGHLETCGRRRSGYIDITVETTRAQVEFLRLMSAMRCLYHIVEIRREAQLDQNPDLDTVVALAAQAEFPELMGHPTFAVRCRRIGTHAFSSVDVEREVGAHLVDRFGAPVNLTEPDITVRVIVRHANVLVGILHTPVPLDRRYDWVYRPRVTLRTVVACALLRLANIDPEGGALVDPFCGSGTIPVETASCYPGLQIFASDLDPAAVATTRANVAVTGFQGRVETRCADFRQIGPRLQEVPVQAIVTNPPYGIRLDRSMNFGPFYEDLLSTAAAIVAPGGRLVLMSAKRRGRLNRVLAGDRNWAVKHVRVIETGGVYPGIFVLKRR